MRYDSKLSLRHLPVAHHLHLVRHLAHEELVVRHEDDAAVEALHAVGERGDRLEVEVVRRLVEDEHVRQYDTAASATRER